MCVRKKLAVYICSNAARGGVGAAALAFAIVHVVNVVLLGAVVVAGWGLRGSAYELGRPTHEDRVLELAYIVAMALGLAANVVVPLVAFALRRRALAAGVLAAWLTLPIAFAWGVALVGLVGRALLP